MSDDPKILGFPKAEEVPPEERARRLRVEVERLASFSASERLYYVECTGVAEKHAVSRDILREMIETTIKANKEKVREDKAEDRQRARHDERKQERAERDRKREEREQEREQERARKEAERIEREQEIRRKKLEAVFAEIAKLPQLTHTTRPCAWTRTSTTCRKNSKSTSPLAAFQKN